MDDDGGEWQWGSGDAARTGMRNLDSCMRCSICSSVFTIAVHLKTCGHAFCSACIRHSLNYKGQCPMCRKPADLNDVVSNPPLQVVVSAFKALRPAVLSALTGAPTPTAAAPVTTVAAPVTTVAAGAGAGAGAAGGGGTPAGKRQRLPMTMYSLLKDGPLRALVAKVGLPAHGSRDTVIARHRHFVTLYNSELDSISPRPVTGIVRDVLVAERSRALSGGPAARKRARPDAAVRNATFNKLVASVRARKAQKQQQQQQQQQQGPEAVHLAPEVGAESAAADAVATTTAPTGVSPGPAPAPSPSAVTLNRWRCVWSSRLERPFFYNESSGIGQWTWPVDVPGDALRGLRPQTSAPTQATPVVLQLDDDDDGGGGSGGDDGGTGDPSPPVPATVPYRGDVALPVPATVPYRGDVALPSPAPAAEPTGAPASASPLKPSSPSASPVPSPTSPQATAAGALCAPPVVASPEPQPSATPPASDGTMSPTRALTPAPAPTADDDTRPSGRVLQWQCRTCTLINHLPPGYKRGRRLCSACETPMPPSALKHQVL